MVARAGLCFPHATLLGEWIVHAHVGFCCFGHMVCDELSSQWRRAVDSGVVEWCKLMAVEW